MGNSNQTKKEAPITNNSNIGNRVAPQNQPKQNIPTQVLKVRCLICENMVNSHFKNKSTILK